MPYDLFISYSRRDNEQGRVTQLVKRIKQDFALFAKRDLVPFFDVDEIHGMQDWRQRILKGLRESRLFLACLSPEYLKSDYCEWEFIEYLKYEIGHLHGFNGVAPIYFVVVPGWDDKDFDKRSAGWVAELRRRQNFDLRPWHDQGEDALREAAVRERMAKLNHQIAETILRGERAEKSLGNVDAHNPHFIGRLANLRMLRDNFVKPGNIGVLTAVNGVGGLGKTALAIEYAHAFADEYGGGRWQVRCAGKDDLRLALAELATPIGFKFTDDEKKNADMQLERTRRELKKLADTHEPHRCLLLLDNVDRPSLLDPAQVARLNGGDWLHILATTRLGGNELYGSHRDRSFLAVDELPPDDALALIENYQHDGRFRSEVERDAARAIVRLLGCFTLAVESSAVYLGQFANDVTCVAFLARLRKEGLEGLDAAASQSSEGVLHGEKRLSATLQPTMERLGAAEKLVLEFAALLPPDQVSLPWLRSLVAKTFPEMERDAEPGYPDSWKNVVRSLISLRLLQSTDVVDADSQPRVVRLHRLVQQLMLSNCGPERQAVVQLALDTLIREREASLEAIVEWVEARWELGPLNALAWLWDQRKHPRAEWLLSHVGMHWLTLAEWGRCEPLFRRALAIEEGSFGPEHPNVATALNNLAQLLRATNRLAEAEPLMRRALAIAERSFGPEHPSVPNKLGNLAQLLLTTNRLAEAEPLMRRALAIDEKSYGLNHPETALRLNNLAELLEVTNRLAEAEPLRRRVVAIFENNAPERQPFYAASLNNLADLLRTTNRAAEAEPLMRRALAIEERNLGPEHPNVAAKLNSLAFLLRTMNRLLEAEPLMRRALAIDEKSYGPEHPSVADQLQNLAQLLERTNRLAEAEPLMRRALAIDEKSYGPEHPRVAGDLNDLAVVLQDMNRLAEAEPLMRCALAIDEKSYGPEHPRVARALNNLAEVLKDTNRGAEAEPMYRRALAIDEKSYGPEHPNVAIRLTNLAGLLAATNRGAEAEPMYRRALAIDEKSYGPEHPDVARDLNNLASFLQRTNRLAEAEPLKRRALNIWEKGLGTEHPMFAIGLYNLAILLRDTNRLAEAEPLVRRAISIFEKSLGDDHPHVATGLNDLALLLEKMGRLAEAESMLRRALTISERSLRQGHPYYATTLDNLARLLQAMNRLAEAEPLYRRALAIREKALVPGHQDTFKSTEALAGVLEATGRLEEAVPLHLRIKEHKLGSGHPDTLRSWNNYSVELLKHGHAEHAEAIIRKVAATTAKILGDAHPLTIHRCNNLVLTLIMLSKLEEARQILATNWRLQAPSYANTTPRIALLRYVVAFLESQLDTPFLGQLKTLLAGPELPVAPDVVVPWDIAYFVEGLHSKLQPASSEFVGALIAVLNDHNKLADLDRFPEWRNQAPIPLDTPWPSELPQRGAIGAVQ